MNDEDLCSLWRRFLTGADEGVVFDDELLDHVETCQACQANVQAGDPENLWRKLAGTATEDETLAMRRLSERYDRQKAIASAVEQQLIPSLSEGVQGAWRSIDPLALFRGINAVALLVRGFPEPDEPPPEFVLRDGSGVWIDHDCVIPRSTLEAEVARSTSTAADGRGPSGRGVMSKTSVPRFVKWLPQAARDNENLFLGLRSSPVSLRDASLAIVERDNTTDLGVHWYEGASQGLAAAAAHRTPPRAAGRAPHATPSPRAIPYDLVSGSPDGTRAHHRTSVVLPAVSSHDDHVHHTPLTLPAMKPIRVDEE